MDKKNTLIGIALLAAALGLTFYSSSRAPAPQPVPSYAPPPSAPVTGANLAPSPAQAALPASSPADAAFAALSADNTDETLSTLSNDFVTVTLTDFGGAIRDVAFKKYPAAKDTPGVPFVFNKARAAPILALDIPGADPSVRHERVSASASEVVYRAVIRDANGAPLVEVTRRYSLTTAGADDPRDGKNDPYRIRHETTFRNLSAQPQHAFPSLNIGTTALLSTGDSGQFLNIAHFDGDKPRIINRGDLEGGGFMTLFGAHNPPKAFVEAAGSIEWGAAKNQFFAAIYTPDQPAAAIVARRISLPPLVPGSLQENIGMTASLRLNPVAIPSGENAAVTLGGYLYAGPKEYVRLAKFPKAEDKVMEFDSSFYNRVTLSGYIAPVMSMLMVWMHGFTDNWGLAVVCMTLLLKFICVPFTLAASRSAKRMQKLQPAMKELREKYKDAPQKLNQATMQLFKDNKVNPLGGCLPVFITIPLFIAFFWMLQGTAELRFQSFLWNHDLSAPDTVFRLWGIPLNIMPLLMGATMIIQMRLTPQPSVDNAQARIFKWMPVFFTFICYNFSAALALYSTVNGLFTIGQQLVVNKLTRDEPANLSHVPGHGKPARPSKKHRR